MSDSIADNITEKHQMGKGESLIGDQECGQVKTLRKCLKTMQ